MATLSRLKPGQVVYSVVSQRMGNTTIRRKVCYTVKILAVDLPSKRVQISWNGNAPEWAGEHRAKGWKLKEPNLKGRGLF